ncbi:MAG TPA: DUF6159 family protein [Candidatus Thermoplasmatota archaeon]|nr:DUF6159 family protein [Candidatus Thermoplasmatota archaeon]
MGRFARSWDLFKTSLSVVLQDKELLWMPVLSALASIVAVLAVTGVGLGSGLWPQTTNPDGTTNYAGAALAFVLYILLAFVTLFFNAAVVAGATERLKGGDPTMGSALGAAWKKAGRLFLWSIVVATVNVILQAIRERSGALGRILASLGGIAWNLATFFMVPVLIFEDDGLGRSVKRSAGLFKQTWGETVIGQAGLGLAGMVFTVAAVLVGLLVLFLLAPLGVVGLVTGIAVLVLGVVLVAALFSVLDGVYKAALYRYATTGVAAGGFQPGQLGGAFAQK